MTLILEHGLPLVALLIFVNELGVPTAFPAEIALLLTGAYAVDSPIMLVGASLLIAAADMAGATVLHLAVRAGGHRLAARFLPAHRPDDPAVLRSWRGRPGRRDAAVIAAVRSLPLVRMYGSIGAGLVRVRLRDFLLGAGGGALVWVGTPVTLGYLLRPRVHGMADRFAETSDALMLVLPAATVLAAGIALLRHRRALRRAWTAWRARTAPPPVPGGTPARLPAPSAELRPLSASAPVRG